MRKTPTETTTANLVAALKSAGPADVAALDEEIDAVGKRIAALQQEQSCLRHARKMVDIKLNGSPLRNRKDGGNLRKQRLDEIFEYLDKSGPAAGVEISNATKIPKGSMTPLLKHEWFVRNSEGLFAIAKTSGGPAGN